MIKSAYAKPYLKRLKSGHLSQLEASRRLSLSYRQTKRSYKRFLTDGDHGLVHKNRGRKSNVAYSPSFKKRVIELYEEKYLGFGPTLAAEKLE